MKTLGTATLALATKQATEVKPIRSTKRAKEIIEGIAYTYLQYAEKAKVLKQRLDEVDAKRKELGKVLTDTSQLAGEKTIVTNSLIITRVDSHSSTIKKDLLLANGVSLETVEASTAKVFYCYPRIAPTTLS